MQQTPRYSTYKYFKHFLPATLLFIVGASATFHLLHNRNKGKSQDTYTVLSHNAGGILDNPLEYRSSLQTIAEHTNDIRLKESIQRLLEIDTQFIKDCKSSIGCEPGTEMEDALVQLGNALINNLKEEKALPPTATLESPKFYNKTTGKWCDLCDYTPLKSLFKGEFGRDIDKAMRTLGFPKFSPLHYNPSFSKWLSENSDHLDITQFTTHWIEAITPHFHLLYEQAMKEHHDLKRFITNFFITFLFDFYSTRRLYENGVVSDYLYVAQELAKSALGDPALRQNRLTTLYQRSKTDILFIQECDPALAEALLKKDYFLAKPTPGAPSTKAEGSLIFYRKGGPFSAEKISPIPITQAHLAPYKRELDKRSAAKLLSNEVAINKIYHQGNIWLVASFHATSNGKNSIPFLRILFDIAQEVEKSEKRPVFVVVGLDANTSTDHKLIATGEKGSYQKVCRFIRQQGYQVVLTGAENPDTVDKERSSFQVQTSKAHQRAKGISDFVVLSKQAATSEVRWTIVVHNASLGDNGPTLEGNPSDHRMVITSFCLRKAAPAANAEAHTPQKKAA